jgi:hypothetical protein
MTAPADPAQLDLVPRLMDRVGNSGASRGPHIHIQAQTLPTGITDITTIDGPQLLKTLFTYPLLFRRPARSGGQRVLADSR